MNINISTILNFLQLTQIGSRLAKLGFASNSSNYSGFATSYKSWKYWNCIKSCDLLSGLRQIALRDEFSSNRIILINFLAGNSYTYSISQVKNSMENCSVLRVTNQHHFGFKSW